MEINKILLGSINALNNVQLLSSDKEIVQSESSAVLHEEGDTSSEIVQKEVSCYNLKSITTDNADEILKNSGGKKTFIVIGNKFEDGSGCGACKAVSSKINEAAQEMKDEANFVELNYNQNKELLKQLKKELNYTDSIGFPAIIVCDENGNPEKLLNGIYYQAQNVNNKSGLSELLRHELGTSEIDKQISEKGTTFIYAHASKDTTKFNEIAEALGSQATFINIDTSGDYTAQRIIRELQTEVNGKPLSDYIIKCVDGKPVELISPSSIKANSKTDTATAIEFYKNKIDGQENIEKLTSDNADTYLRGTEGTSYIILGNTNCPHCVTLAPYLSQVATNLGDDANFLEMTYSQNKDLYNELKKEAGQEGSVSFPVIIKCVDGKATEFIPVSQYNTEANKKDNTVVADITSKLKSKIEGTYKENPNKNVQETSSKDEKEITTTLDGNSETEQANQEEIVAKQKLAVMKENLQLTNNFVQEIVTDSLENAIENAASVSDLKNAVFNYSTGLDFNIQISLQSVVNGLSEEADLSSAKEKLLELL